MKKINIAGIIVIIIVLACIVWAFLHPTDLEEAIGVGVGALVLGWVFGAFETD